MYSIYLTSSAKEEMQEQNEAENEKINERLTFLQQGYWKNGTRVKKLKGLNKLPIYEARIDKANRMLFTPIQTVDNEIKQTAILVHNLSVEHDKVIRTAKAILGDGFNEEQYNMAEETIESLEQILQEAETQWHPQYNHVVNHLKMYHLDEDTIIRFMQKSEIASEEFWEMKLKLTQEQQQVLMRPLPLLMSGTAGSGKTTIVIHKLLSDPNVKKLYITFNKELVQDAKSQFLSLIRGIDEELQYKENTEFLSFEDILAPLKKDEFKPVITKDHLVYEYSKYVRGSQLDKILPPMMVWEEIRGVWKSGAFTENEKVLSRENYIALTEQEAPNFFGKREKAYEVLEWYVQWMRRNSMVDEQDLLSEALQKHLLSYGLVICDEVQDLSMLHIEFVFRLAGNDSGRIILTGDDQQVIQHSGFRWENIKNAFYKKLNTKVNEIVQLSRNFRNTGTIARLAASINDLQKEYTDFQYKTKETKYYESGRTPVLYKSIEKELLMGIMNQYGPNDAVLVRDEKLSEELSQEFIHKFGQKPMIFTIAQAKGLEFQRVFLWSLFAPDREEEQKWSKLHRILEKNQHHLIANNTINQRFIRYEASLLYVAVTRGIKECYIYDGPEISAFWKINKLPQNLEVISEIISPEASEKPASNENWVNQGINLLNKKLFHQALECFRRVPDGLVKQYKLVCEANIAKELSNFEEAAGKFEVAGYFEESLHCLDVLARYEEAQRLCERVIRKQRQEKQTVHLDYWEYLKSSFKVKEFDQKEKWVGSAIYCKRIGKYIEAANRFEKANPNLASNTDLQRLFDEITNITPIEDAILERAIKFYETTKNPRKLSYLLQYKQSKQREEVTTERV
jgi:DNA helicase II / ATP-dependent DNA helicase PcrA